MASISTDRKGNRRILFTGLNRQRKIVYLGHLPMKTAREIKTRVEHLAAAVLAGHALEPEVAEWLGGRDDVLYGKLAAVGLVPAREPEPGDEPQGLTLADFIDQYITARKIQKPNTLKNYQATRRALVDFFGQGRLLAEITPGDCDDWRAHQVGLGLAPATIGRTVKRARQFFCAAVRKKIIAESPMQDVKAAPQDNKSREYFVTVEETEEIMGACPDAEWRLIVALARYGGLRTPSETFALTWDCVDWERERVRIPSPKTEHHAGREARTIPLFPELRPYLDAVFFSPEARRTRRRTRDAEDDAATDGRFSQMQARNDASPWNPRACARMFYNVR